MERLETLVRETMAEHAKDAPGGALLLEAVMARTAGRPRFLGFTRSRRRREWAAVLATVAVVVAVVLAASLLPRAGHRPAPAAPVKKPASPVIAVPPGMQPVSFHGLEVFVPAAWKLNDELCGTPLHDTAVIDDGGATEACLRPETSGLTVVRLTAADSATQAELAVATTPTLVAGTPAKTGLLARTGPGAATPLRVFVVTAVGVVMTIEAPSDAAAAKLIDGVRFAPVDSFGCRAQTELAGSVSGNIARTAAANHADLVPGNPTTAVLCRYSGGWLARSVRLTTRQRAQLVSTLNALPAGRVPPSADATSSVCAQDAGKAILAVFGYADGSRVTVLNRISACFDAYATNGFADHQVNDALSLMLVGEVGFNGAAGVVG